MERIWPVSEDLAGRLGEGFARWWLAMMAVNDATVAGELAEAERLVENVLEVGLATDQPEVLLGYGYRLAACCEPDRGSEIIAGIEVVLDDNPGLPASRLILAGYYCDIGRAGDARGLLETDFDNRRRHNRAERSQNCRCIN